VGTAARVSPFEITGFIGDRAREDAPPSLLVEVPHGATRTAHYETLRKALQGHYARDLRDFFHVNTDVGAPEVAEAIAESYVERHPERNVTVVRCLLPRTFVDCNRVIAPDAAPRASAAGEMTPGLPPYVRDAADVRLLLDLHAEYRKATTEMFDEVCGAGGQALMLHSYAPRSVDVAVDENIVASLRDAYRPEKIGTWPLRAEVDMITHAPDGTMVGSEALAARVRAGFEAEGLRVAQNEAYALHPSTLAHLFATHWPGRTLCVELRRDLLVREFTPFAEMDIDPAKADRIGQVLARAFA
jgi:predicted N-formylglutamate amidohydrolase